VIVMPANNSGVDIGYLAGRYEGSVGWLMSPAGYRTPKSYMPYALDNGMYGAWERGVAWDEGAFLAMLERVRGEALRPRWVVVPDAVGDREETLRRWEQWYWRLPGHHLAMAVQDGMTPDDVPDGAVVFVGGTTRWKWGTVKMWAENFPRVHVGRVNTYNRLWQCAELGVESCDGTGWTRGDQAQWLGLCAFLAEQAEGGKRQGRLCG
jgi:hypothetical protein